MGTGYTRNDTVNNIADGNIINASDIDGEYDAIQAAFDAATGHTHDGTTGEGAPIEVTGPAQEYVSTGTEFRPKANNTYDLGSSGNQWKDLYVDGTANLDAVDIDGGNIDGTVIGAASAAAGTFTTATATTGNITTVNATTVDTTNIEVTNIKAKDGTAAGSIANSTGVVTLSSSVLTTTDINGGTIDGADVTVGTGKTLNVSAGTLTLANDQISGDKVEGGTINAITINTLGSTTGNITTVNATTVDSTNVEVTNIKAKDGTASATIADSTGVMTVASSVLTTADINGGTIDGTVIGGSTPAAISGTTGSFSGNLSVDTNTLFVDAANNRVGVGTASPGRTLDVSGVIRSDGTSGAVAFGGNSSTPSEGAAIHRPAADTLAFVTASTERARIDASGNVGIGVVPSAWASFTAMQFGETGCLASNAFSSSNTQTFFGNNVYFDGAYKYIATGSAATQYLQLGSEHRWNIAPSGTAGNAITFTQAMTLDASGNVGIGTSSPAANHKLTLDQAGFVQMLLSTSGTQRLSLYGDASISAVDAKANPLAFYAGSGERARIDASGNLLVGVTATGGGGAHLIQAGTGVNALQIQNNGTDPYGPYINFSAATPNNTVNYFMLCGDPTATRATLRSNGGLANYQSNDVDLSDERTKTEIVAAPSYWDKIAALEIVTYKYKDQTHDDVNVGVIAQQVETVEPVWVDSDGFGKTPEGEEPLKTVYTKDITFAAIKALQEAMTRIEALEARITALEA